MSLLCAPLLINVLIVVLNLHSLEYCQGEAGFYSMGISVYTCFAMIAIYILLNIVHVFRRWDSIDSHKRVNMVTCLLVVANQERAKKSLPNDQVHDTSMAIKTAIEAIRILIQQEKENE